MKNTLIYIAIVSLLASCMAADPEMALPDSLDPDMDSHIKGCVRDTLDNPIEHLKVTLDWNNGMYQDIKYTDSDGIFVSGIQHNPENGNITLTVTIEDIDGEENGGSFESCTDTITLFPDELQSGTIVLDYHLNLSTASENSPQS